MKTLATLSLGLIALAGLCPSAHAAEPDFKFAPYVGFDLQRHSVDYKDGGDAIAEDGLNGVNIHVGNRFHKNFGAELGYYRSENAGKNFTVGALTGDSKIRVQGLTLDGLGYLPLDNTGKFELIGTAGIAWSKADYKLSVAVPGFGSGTASGDESELGLRAGAGAQVSLTNNINARGLVRYQTADFDDTTDHIVTYSLGLNYAF